LQHDHNYLEGVYRSLLFPTTIKNTFQQGMNRYESLVSLFTLQSSQPILTLRLLSIRVRVDTVILSFYGTGFPSLPLKQAVHSLSTCEQGVMPS